MSAAFHFRASRGRCDSRWLIRRMSGSSPAPKIRRWLANLLGQGGARTIEPDDEDRQVRGLAPPPACGEKLEREGGDRLVDLAAQRIGLEDEAIGLGFLAAKRIGLRIAAKGFLVVADIVKEFAEPEGGCGALLDRGAPVGEDRAHARDFGLVWRRLLAQGEIAMRGGEIRSDCERPAEAGDRVVEMSERTVGDADAIPGRGVLRIERQRRPVQRQRLLAAIEARADPAQRIVRLDEARIERQRPPQRRFGRREALFLEQRAADRHMRLAKVRVELNGARAAGQGLLMLAEIEQHDREIAMREREIGPQLDGAAITPNRRLRLRRQVKGAAEREMRERVARFQRQRPADRLPGPIPVFALERNLGQHQQRARLARRLAQRLAAGRFGGVVVAGIAQPRRCRKFECHAGGRRCGRPPAPEITPIAHAEAAFDGYRRISKAVPTLSVPPCWVVPKTLPSASR